MNKFERRQQGIKKAHRVLSVWRAIGNNYANNYYKNGGDCEKMLRKTRVPCSCMMCGNPRKYGKVTRQEKINSIEAIW